MRLRASSRDFWLNRLAVNIDEYLIKGDDVKLNQKEEKMVAMQNGCICCTLREDLLIEIAKLANEGRFDYLVIESTGISEPMPVAETFTFNAPASVLGVTHSPLSSVARLDTMVTVVDAHNFYKDIASVEMVAAQQQQEKEQRKAADAMDIAVPEEDNRSIAHLLADQIEFANVILLNKMDLISDESAREIEEMLKRMNPRAKLFRTQHSSVALSEVINTGLFDMESFTDVLLKEHGVLADAPPARRPESIEYGISSFVYRRERPFHPERLNVALGKQLPNVYRSKGIVWLAHRSDMVLDWNGVGEIIFLEPGGPWAADMTDEARGELPSHLLSRIRPNDPFGDRRQEIVIIGKDLDKAAVEAVLDGCLVTEEEMIAGLEAWLEFSDPFGFPLGDDDDGMDFNTNLGQGDHCPAVSKSHNLLQTLEDVLDLKNSFNIGVASRTESMKPELSQFIDSLLEKCQEKLAEIAEQQNEGGEPGDESEVLGEHVSYFEGDLSNKKLFVQLKKGLKALISDAFSPIVGKKKSHLKTFLKGVSLLTDDIMSLLLAYNNVWNARVKGADVPVALKQCSVFRIGIELLRESVCPQYHYDHVLCRMLCAYAGAGTVFVASTNVDHAPLNDKNKQAIEDAENEVCRLGEDIVASEVAKFNNLVAKSGASSEISTSQGDVILLKGSRWPGNENFPAIHRSPAAAADSADGLRLLLRVDYISNAAAQRMIAEDQAEAEGGSDADEEEDEEDDVMDV